MTQQLPLTVGQLKELLRDVDDDLHIYVDTPARNIYGVHSFKVCDHLGDKGQCSDCAELTLQSFELTEDINPVWITSGE